MLNDQATHRHLTTQRAHEILDAIQLAGGACRVQFLAERLKVTEETIRRNIKMLEASGHVRKVHGGVHLKNSHNEQSFQQRMGKNPDGKHKIAARVADMICDGESLFLDTGSTTAYIATALQNHKNLFVVTNSILVAHTLSTRNNNRIFFAGGELRARDGGVFGIEATKFISRFKLQRAILSVAAIDANNGFMLHDIQEAEFSRQVFEQANNCIIAADSNKFKRHAPIILDSGVNFDLLVTDKAPNKDVVEMLHNNDIQLEIA